jgi:hypothetical protein
MPALLNSRSSRPNDLRNRALARAGPALPVMEIATVAPLTIDVASPAFDALLLMARHNIHHVPVLDGHAVAGMVTATDVTEQHSTSAVYLAGEIHKQTTSRAGRLRPAKVRALQRTCCRRVPAPTAPATSSPPSPTPSPRACCTLAEAKLGPAPVDYAWVAAGSQARSEQTAKSDQDNCLVLDDATTRRARRYFKRAGHLRQRRAGRLRLCLLPRRDDGPHRPVAAAQRRWAEYFRRWTARARAQGADADLRVLRPARGARPSAIAAGRPAPRRAARTRDNRIFLAYMVGNALTHRPPLGLFGGMSTVTLRRAARHHRSQAQRHRAHRRSGAHLCAGRRPRRGQHPRPPAGRRAQRRNQRAERARPARRAGVHGHAAHPPPGRARSAPGGARTTSVAVRVAEQLRAWPAQGRLRRGADAAERAGPALPRSSTPGDHRQHHVRLELVLRRHQLRRSARCGGAWAGGGGAAVAGAAAAGRARPGAAAGPGTVAPAVGPPAAAGRRRAAAGRAAAPQRRAQRVAMFCACGMPCSAAAANRCAACASSRSMPRALVSIQARLYCASASPKRAARQYSWPRAPGRARTPSPCSAPAPPGASVKHLRGTTGPRSAGGIAGPRQAR